VAWQNQSNTRPINRTCYGLRRAHTPARPPDPPNPPPSTYPPNTHPHPQVYNERFTFEDNLSPLERQKVLTGRFSDLSGAAKTQGKAGVNPFGNAVDVGFQVRAKEKAKGRESLPPWARVCLCLCVFVCRVSSSSFAWLGAW
jgi:hypothetical protein